MSLETEATTQEIAILREAVGDAGTLVMRYFGQNPETWDKPGEGPVSEADLAANDLLRERLCGAFPAHGWLSEESVDDPARLACERVWIVDPIDGTRAFVDGKQEFTVCAALAVRGEIVAGAVLNPAKQEFFFAAKGQGASRNGEPLLSGPVPAFEDAGILSRRSLLDTAKWQGEAPGGQHGYVNSIAYRVCKVATDRWDAAIALNNLSEWDLAAAQIILHEAGGRMTDRAGNPIRYNSADTLVAGLVAAADPLHGQIIGRLMPVGA